MINSPRFLFNRRALERIHFVQMVAAVHVVIRLYHPHLESLDLDSHQTQLLSYVEQANSDSPTLEDPAPEAEEVDGVWYDRSDE
jgi:hypothetical protein